MTNLAESDQAILAASAMRETTADGTALTAKSGGRWLTLALVVAAYIAAALPGVLVALPPGYASPVWPAAGLALAALLMLGPRLWPGVWLGAFLVDLWLDVSVTGAAVAALIATGATLQALVGARLTRRFLAAPVPLARDADVRRFLLLAGPLACLVVPTLGVATLYGFGRLAAADLVSQWLSWWAGDALGVLLFAPLALLAWPGVRSFGAGNGVRIALPLLVTALLLAAGEHERDRLEQSEARQAARRLMDDDKSAYFLPLPTKIEPLRGVERLFAASGEVTRQEFAIYTVHALRQPGILASVWAPRVAQTERAAFEAARREEVGDFQITEPLANGRLVRAGERAEYFPAHFVEPREDSEALFGLDHAAIAARRTAMARAATSGAAAAAEPLTLIRTGRPGVLVYVPVYRSGFDAAIVEAAARREALRGFVIGVFDIERLFTPLAHAASQQQLAFRISDVTPGEAERVLAGALTAGAAPSMSQEVEFAGRIWRLEMQPGRTDWQAGATLQARLFLGFEVLAAFLVAFATLASAGRNAATATEVAERTADLDRELRARRAAEAALRASEARLRAILEAALDCIITIDHEGRIVEFNPAAERTFGYRRAEVIGKEMAALMIPSALREGYRRSLATGEGPLLDGRMEIRVLRADGAEIPAEIAVTRIGVEGPSLFTAYLRDVTDQKAARQALESTGARLQHLLISSPTVIYSMAATGAYACSFISENLLDLIGYQATEHLNDKDFWLEHVHPDDKTRVLAEFEGTVPRERGAFEYRFLHKDGRYRWIDDSYRLTRGTEGQPLEIIGSWIDITARKEAEAQRDRFFSLSLDLLCIAGTDGYFKRVNPAFGQTLGWSDEELLARPFLDFVHPEDVAATLLEVERLKTGQPTLHFENRYRCKDGGWRWLAWKAVAQPDGLLYSAARDVTGQREANRQLEQAKADAEQANRAKSAFLAVMSHEIRTPMNGVIGMVEVLAQSSLSAQQADAVGIVRDSAFSLLAIIDDILDFSKIEAGRLELERVLVSVADMVEDICTSLVPVAVGKGVDLTLFIAPAVPEQAWSDPTRLRQVLYNLVGNAIKFSGGRPERRGRVTVRMEVVDARTAAASHPRRRQRHRHGARDGERTLHALHPGRGFHQAALRWHRAGARHLQAAGGPDAR